MRGFINRFRNITVVMPNWSFWQKLENTLLSYFCFFQHRFDTLLFLLFNYYPYKTYIFNKKNLDKFLSSKGVVFISIHSGPYPLAGKIFSDNYPKHKLIVPFYWKDTLSIYPFFRKMFPKIGIQIIKLAGAMKEIDPILSLGGSTCLFLDAVLPVKHFMSVNIFNKKVPISTGPLYLAKRYNMPIIPIYTVQKKKTVILKVLNPIKYKNKSDKESMGLIGKTLEKMVLDSLSQWQVVDKFLLR